MAESNSNVPVIVYVSDDNKLLRMLFSDILTEGGYRVLEVGNASDALLLLAGRSDIDLLLTDVNVPGEINGFMLARRVQQRRPEIGIILMSGGETADPGDVPEGAAWLRKPVSPANLIIAVTYLMAKRDMRVSSSDAAPGLPFPDAISSTKTS